MGLERFFRYPTQTVEYVANISERFGYFYLANPKVASTGILRTLQSAEVDGDQSRIPEFVHDRPASPLLSFSSTTQSPEHILTAGRVFRFTYVRNPFTRILSAYIEKIETEAVERERLLPTLGLPPDRTPTLLEFLEAVQAQRDDWRDIHWTTQSRLVQTCNIDYSFIGRFESFSTSFPKVLDRLGIDRAYYEAGQAPHHATNANSRVLDYIGPAEREIIVAIYHADFSGFAYGVDPATAHL
jgi:hypothetical protein